MFTEISQKLIEPESFLIFKDCFPDSFLLFDSFLEPEEYIRKAAICRCSSKQVFMKILGENFGVSF